MVSAEGGYGRGNTPGTPKNKSLIPKRLPMVVWKVSYMGNLAPIFWECLGQFPDMVMSVDGLKRQFGDVQPPRGWMLDVNEA